MMVALALSSMLLARAGSLWLFGSRSFAAMGNYADLDARSRNALDLMSRDIRQATQVTGVSKDRDHQMADGDQRDRGHGDHLHLERDTANAGVPEDRPARRRFI